MNDLNGVVIANNGIQNFLRSCEVALIKTTLNVNGQATATAIILQDRNNYPAKKNGEAVANPNGGKNLTVHITGDTPVINQFVTGIQFENLRVTSVYATSQQDSTFATVHYSLTADRIIFPKKQGE